MLNRVEVDVRNELQNQLEQWGVQHHDDYKWYVILMEEIGEVARAILEKDMAGRREELVQCAAVIENWLGDIDDNS